MKFKLSPKIIAAAIGAGAAAFGVAYEGAALDSVVNGGEWLSIVTATVIAAAGVFLHDTKAS